MFHAADSPRKPYLSGTSYYPPPSSIPRALLSLHLTNNAEGFPPHRACEAFTSTQCPDNIAETHHSYPKETLHPSSVCKTNAVSARSRAPRREQDPKRPRTRSPVLPTPPPAPTPQSIHPPSIPALYPPNCHVRTYIYVIHPTPSAVAPPRNSIAAFLSPHALTPSHVFKQLASRLSPSLLCSTRDSSFEYSLCVSGIFFTGGKREKYGCPYWITSAHTWT